MLEEFKLSLTCRVSVELGLADGVDGGCTLDLRLEGMGGRGVATDLPVVGVSSQPVDVVDNCADVVDNYMDNCGSTWRTQYVEDKRGS